MDRGLGHRLASITWPFAAIMALMLTLAMLSMSIVSATRAYVMGEGLWSKAERDAVASLVRYGSSGHEADYTGFLRNLEVPLGDRRARLALQQEDPDEAAAAAGFTAGRIPQQDIPGMIRLFKYGQDVPLFARAIATWAEGDAMIDLLLAHGTRLRDEMARSEPQTDEVTAILADLRATHEQVAQLEVRFSEQLAEASAAVTHALLATLGVCSFVLLALGTMMSRRMLQRSEAMTAKLRVQEAAAYAQHQRADVTLRSIGDAVIAAGRSGYVEYLNPAAERLTGWNVAEAVGKPLEEVFRLANEQQRPALSAALQDVLLGGHVRGLSKDAVLVRRDGTEVSVQEQAAPIRDRNGSANGIVLVLRDVTQERALASQLQFQASHDALTGLANRREFERELHALIDDRVLTRSDHAVLYLDLDQFKVVNDTCGHPAGDALIRQLASTVLEQLRVTDLLARLGGDEFGVLLPGSNERDALAAAERIRRSISESRFAWEGRVFSTSVSVGVLVLDDTLRTVADVMSTADRVCYAAKDNGRNRVQLYCPADRELLARHGEMEWVARISAALEHDRFLLHAQEVRAVDPQSGRPSRYEILIRMRDEQDNLVLPMAFIPAAERYGLMGRIDRWVIEHTLRELAKLRQRQVETPVCMINLSGVSLTDATLVEFIIARLAAVDLPASTIGFELTETAAITNVAKAAHLMRRLKALGCTIALDDFGSGMSSFAYLRSLPIDYLKIDGNFVRDMARDKVDYAMVESIRRIGSVFGIATVAEWVEDEATLHALGRIGVDYAQGFGVARPIPLEQLTHAIDAGARVVDMAAAAARRAAAG